MMHLSFLQKLLQKFVQKKQRNYEKLVKIIENNDARLILHRKLNGAMT